MKAITVQELRIGNYVNTTQGIGVVTSLDRDTKEAFRIGVVVKPFKRYTLRNPECTPIELTPEILEKAGFEKGYDNGNPYWLTDIAKRMVFFIYEKGGRSGISIGAPEWRDYPCNESCEESIVDIKYVHQLQNLIFSLTGEELTINI